MAKAPPKDVEVKANTDDEGRRVRGLKSLHQSRENRLTNKVRYPSTRFWTWAVMVLVAGGIVYWKWSENRLERRRAALLADQRGAAKTLDATWGPVRDRLETWTTELAAAPAEGFREVIEKEALAAFDFRAKPGIYLRLRVEDAASVEAIRKHATESLRDAFTACLLRVPNADPFAGRACKRTSQCDPGQVCNENDRCAAPAQPYNLRVAYRALRVFQDGWVREVQEAGTDLRLAVLRETFADSVKDDVPIAADLLARAQYFLVVLDETPPGKAVSAGDGGTAMEAVQLVPHKARVALYRLSDQKLLLRVRREAGGELIGAAPVVDSDVAEARQRQANSCALALEVRQAIGDHKAAANPTAP